MAVAVGGANGLISRLLTLLGLKATTTTTDPERVDCLNFLNFAEKFILTREALLCKAFTWEISVAAAATKIDLTAAPFTTVKFDYGKDHVLLDGNGTPLEYAPPDRFHRLQATTDAVFAGPSGYMISVDAADSKRKLYLSEAQPTLATFTLYGQRLPVDLTDEDTSFSLLPEGREITLLLPVAEQYAKQRGRQFDVSMLAEETRMTLDAFYAEERVNKLTTATDGNTQRRAEERNAKHQTGDD